MPNRLFQLPERTQVEISGVDRVKHLHSFCTNDINVLLPGKGCEAFILNGKGKIIGFVNVFCQAESLVLETVGNQAGDLVNHLDRYVIREDVQFTDRSGQWSELLVESDGVPVFDTKLPADYLDHLSIEIDGVDVSIRRVEWTSTNNLLLSFPCEDLDQVQAKVLESSSICLASESEFETARIEFGAPLFGVDLTSENLPQELNRNARAISFQKGCYLGQETIARLDALGHVNKLFSAVLFESDTDIKAGDALTVDEKPVGKITSACQSQRHHGTLAIGYLKTKFVKPGTVVQAGDRPGKVIELCRDITS